MAASLLSGRLIAVTGTNGKTTTVTLIHRILERAGLRSGLGGNINPPLIALVDEDPDYVVAEISSFQLEWIEHFRAHIAVCLNITPDHLDRYHDMDEYASCKLRLFSQQQKGDTAIVNLDDPRLKTISTQADIIGFSASAPHLEGGAFIREGRIIFPGHREGPALPTGGPLGDGLQEDMLAAALTGDCLGIDPVCMEAVFQEFTTLSHRFETVAEVDGITYIDDSKATNVGAVDKALKGISGKAVLILGGRDKGGDFRELVTRHRERIRLALVLGKESVRILNEITPIVPVECAHDMPEALAKASIAAHPGDTVLLSPGCSSFDMYTSYAHRGEVFTQCVRRQVMSTK